MVARESDGLGGEAALDVPEEGDQGEAAKAKAKAKAATGALCAMERPQYCEEDADAEASGAALVYHRFNDADHNSISLQPNFLSVVQKFFDVA